LTGRDHGGRRYEVLDARLRHSSNPDSERTATPAVGLYRRSGKMSVDLNRDPSGTVRYHANVDISFQDIQRHYESGKPRTQLGK
jgi:hypothetical protein